MTTTAHDELQPDDVTDAEAFWTSVSEKDLHDFPDDLDAEHDDGYLPLSDCMNYGDGYCGGPTFERYSRSGLTTAIRCQACWEAHNQVLDAIEHRYPDSDVAPAWFDPTYAGEHWDSDY